ncbi:MAG: UxaA family hydrolase [Thermoguttaceae bacterium]
MKGYPREDGRKGIRNHVLVVYLVECAHHVAREIALPYRERGVHLIGFPGCYPSPYAERVMDCLCTHPNVGAVLLVSLGCESFHRRELAEAVRRSGRPVEMLVIQEAGGTRATTAAGRRWVEQALGQLSGAPRVEMQLAELVVGTICGGSDATSGLTANPAIGKAFDWLVDRSATAIFEETNEMVGCEQHLAGRATTPELARELAAAVIKAERYHRVLGHGSFAPGNAEGGLTTQEEKSLGAYAKSGCRPVSGLLRPGDRPPRGGLYLLDVVPDGEVRFGFPNISDNTEAADLMACGAHMILFSTGLGSVVGSAIAPVVKVCANPETYRRLREDMDIDAGRILEDRSTLDEVAGELIERIAATADGEPTASESLGHQEFLLTYKRFEPTAKHCLAGG